jgi:hypothetical protein
MIVSNKIPHAEALKIAAQFTHGMNQIAPVLPPAAVLGGLILNQSATISLCQKLRW